MRNESLDKRMEMCDKHPDKPCLAIVHKNGICCFACQRDNPTFHDGAAEERARIVAGLASLQQAESAEPVGAEGPDYVEGYVDGIGRAISAIENDDFGPIKVTGSKGNT